MIEVSEAVKIINEAHISLPSIEIPLEKAVGRVLQQNIYADTDFPPFNRVMMDGIGVKWEDFDRGIRNFRIDGIQAAGSPQMTLSESGSCIQVMTGAVAPNGIDLVIPFEEVQIDQDEKYATVSTEHTESGKNIHPQASDKKAGDLLIEKGRLIGTPEIAIAASVGQSKLLVTKNPAIAIVSTGNELVGIKERPLPHQIRRSNVFAMASELRKMGIKSSLFHIKDDKEVLRKSMQDILDKHEVVLLSGGISKGKFDFVPETLEAVGVQKKFHRIKQKPGKPFLFGVREDKNVVFAFPGNPVSTFMCFHKYFLTWLRRNLGYDILSERKAVLGEDFSIKTGYTYYLQVQIMINTQGTIIAMPVKGKGSGDHANLLSSDAFLELPGNTFQFKKGEVFNLIPFRDI